MNRQTLFLGITLFSMFFGAGNLIFSAIIGRDSRFDKMIGCMA